MTSDRGVPRGRQPRPLSGAPVDALLARAPDLAKAWLIALFERAELEDGPAIPVADLVADGPGLCSAVVRALADDGELRRLELGGALEPLASRAGELAGAVWAEPSARAVDALRAVTWRAAREELVRPDAHELEVLGERLALVTELVRAAVLRRVDRTEAAAGAGVAEASGNGTVVEEVAAYDGAGPEPRSGPGPGPRRGRGPRAPLPRAGAPGAPLPRAGAPGAALARTAADSLWRGALEDEVARAHRSGAPLAVLLAERSDGDGVPAPHAAHVASETFGRFAQAVRSAIRREDILACETQSRAWVIARLTGRAGARVLGSRIARAVQEAEPSRAVPLTIGIGIAILGEDAHDAVGLVEAANEWAFATMSAGPEEADPPTDGREGAASS